MHNQTKCIYHTKWCNIRHCGGGNHSNSSVIGASYIVSNITPHFLQSMISYRLFVLLFKLFKVMFQV